MRDVAGQCDLVVPWHRPRWREQCVLLPAMHRVPKCALYSQNNGFFGKWRHFSWFPPQRTVWGWRHDFKDGDIYTWSKRETEVRIEVWKTWPKHATHTITVHLYTHQRHLVSSETFGFSITHTNTHVNIHKLTLVAKKKTSHHNLYVMEQSFWASRHFNII